MKNTLDSIKQETIVFYPGPEHLFLSFGIFYINKLYLNNNKIIIVFEITYSINTIKLVNELFDDLIIIQLKEKKSLKRHIEIKKNVKELLKKYKPTYLFSISDTILFALYLFRYGKKVKCKNICYMTGMMMGDMKKERKIFLKQSKNRLYFFLRNYYRFSRHIMHYYIFPIMNFEYPFFGKSSSFLRKGSEINRDGEKYLVFSEREVNIRKKDGVSKNKLEIIGNPLKWTESQRIKSYFNEKFKIKNNLNNKTKILLILDDEIGLIDNTLKRIKFDFYLNLINKVILILKQNYTNSEILVKPHPNTYRNTEHIKNINKILGRDNNIFIVNTEIINPHRLIVNNDLFIGEISTFLYLASSYPNKKVISLNLFNRFMGDIYKDFKNIQYYKNIKLFERNFKNK